ncbi:MAG: EF-hand domain-containing protein [Pseudonocardiaceae bacterium]
MGETPDGGESADLPAGVARRTVLRDTAVAGGDTVASPSKPDSATTIAAAERVAAEQEPFLRRKQLWTFEIMDTKGDSAVTPEDTMQFAHRLARLTGHADDSPRAQQIVATVNRIWHALVVKPVWVTDPKQTDAEQFVTVMANSVAETPDKTLRYIGVATNLAFAIADTDHDGLISRDEAIQLVTEVLQVSREHAEHAWTVLDTDGDGYLGYADCLMAVTDFIVSTDPNAPGNLALGHILTA